MADFVVDLLDPPEEGIAVVGKDVGR